MMILNMAIQACEQTNATESERREFYSLVKSANFIAIDSDHLLSMSEKWLRTGPLTQEVEYIDHKMADVPISAPFKCQWMELSHRGSKAMAPSILIDGVVITPLGMMVNEIAPNLYDIFMIDDRLVGGNHIKAFSVLRNVPAYRTKETNLKITLALWIRAINTGAIGVEECEDFALVPKGNSKKKKKGPHQIRRIVRIVPKTMKYTIEPVSPGGRVDFSHRWEVRGHWRRVSGMGKDRNGDYVIRGLTWVKDCIKGPEEMPVVKKLRWVPGEAGQGG